VRRFTSFGAKAAHFASTFIGAHFQNLPARITVRGIDHHCRFAITPFAISVPVEGQTVFSSNISRTKRRAGRFLVLLASRASMRHRSAGKRYRYKHASSRTSMRHRSAANAIDRRGKQTTPAALLAIRTYTIARTF
jgi:hypothetical protein